MKRIYKKKEEGIASTVGTIFALMIFTALLSMFVSQFVPVTMKSNEAQHDLYVLSQFSQLRSTIDIFTLTKDTNYTAYVPIKLGADGIPVFASPTYGQLSMYPSQLSSNYLMSLKFSDRYGNNIYRNASGSLQFIAPNKYYNPEIFNYENGAVLRYNYYSKNAIFSIYPNMKMSAVDEGYAVGVNASTTDYINVPDSPSLHLSSKITMECWFNLKSVPSDYTNLIVKDNSYRIQIKNDGVKFSVHIGGSSGGSGSWIDVTGSKNLQTNRWYYVAGVYDGTQLNVYLNGVSLNTKSQSGSIDASTNPVNIGKGITGIVDEVRILNVALSDTQIEDDYLAGAHYNSRNGQVLWLHLDEGSGDTAVDSSGYKNNGTLESHAYWVMRRGLNMGVTLQSIFGNPSSITGTETRNLAISLQGISDEDYKIGGGNLNLTVNDDYNFGHLDLNFTQYWITYITNILNITGLTENVDYVISGNSLTVYGVEDVTLKMVYVEVEIQR